MTFYAQSSLVMPVQANHSTLYASHENTMSSSSTSATQNNIKSNNNSSSNLGTVANSHSGMSSSETLPQSSSDVSKSSSEPTSYPMQSDDDMCKIPSSWDPQDDILLRHLKEIKKLGWKDIAQYFKNRTPNACQFRWRRLKSGALKHKSVASTMELTDHQLENVAIPDLPASTNSLSTTGASTSSCNVSENDIKKNSRVRKSRASSMVSSSTPRIDENMQTADRSYLQKTHQNSEHQSVVPPQKGFFSTAPASEMNNKFNAMSQVANGFAKPRTYSSSSMASNLSKSSTHYDQNHQAYNGHHSADMNNHLQQQNNGINGNASINGMYTNSHASQLPLPAQSQQQPQHQQQAPQKIHAVSKNDEKIGFIPKVVVRSRRGSSFSNVNSSSSSSTGMLAPGSGFYHADNNTFAPAMKNSFSVNSGFSANINPATTSASQHYLPSSSSSSISITGSSTFSTPKSRKNSFSSRSRAGSFHTGPNERRLSVLLTEKELSIDEKGSETNPRRSSMSVLNRRRGSLIKTHQQPSSHSPSQQLNHSSSSSTNNASNNFFGQSYHAAPWSSEEDKVLLNNSLQKDEISILLGNRSDAEIQKRVAELQNVGFAQEKRHQGHQSTRFQESPRNVNEEAAISDNTSSSSQNVSPSPPIFSEQDREGGVSSVVSSTHSNSNHTNQSRFSPPYSQSSGSFKNRAFANSNMITPTTSGSGQNMKKRNAKFDVQRGQSGFSTQTQNSSNSNNSQPASHFGPNKNGNSPRDSDEDAILDDESEENVSSMNANFSSFNEQQHHHHHHHHHQQQQQQQHLQYQQQHSHPAMHNNFQQHHGEHLQPQHSLPSLNSILRDMM
ncbi:hypothetical protein ACO0QE_004270 [Hanseniaspora vineae]